MFANYFKVAWRNLTQSKVYSAINILGLSLGLACAMLIILYVKDEVSYDRFHREVGQIHRIVSQKYSEGGVPENKDSSTGYLQGPRFAENIPEIGAYVRLMNDRVDVKLGADIVSQELLRSDPNFFSMFTFPLRYGDPLSCLMDPNSVVLSEDLALKYFGTPNAVGRTLMLKVGDSFEPHTVTAVAQRSPQNSSIKFDMISPLQVPTEALANDFNWFNFFLNTFVTLQPGADVALVNKKMQDLYVSQSSRAAKILDEQYGGHGTPSKYYLQPFVDMHLSEDLPAKNGLSGASNPVYSYILSAIAVFILLIACINFINLTVARSVGRAREIGIRKVVGGQRMQLIFQFLCESLLLCFFAFTLAVLLVQLALPVFNGLSNKALAISYLFDAELVLGYGILFVATGFLAGFYPALILSKYRAVETLYSRFVLRGKNRLQKSLVVLQFALASFLIIGTIVLYRQFDFLTTQELGYDDSDLVLVEKQGLTLEELALFRERLTSKGNILEVAAKNSGQWVTVAKVGGDQEIEFVNEEVSQALIPTLGIPLKAGRNFSRDRPSDATDAVLVNEAFVKESGWKDPLGQTVDFWYNQKKYTVIGVVRDYHYDALLHTIGPQLFSMAPASISWGAIYIKIAPGSATASLGLIGKTFRELFPLQPYSYNFLEDRNYENYQAEAKWKQIMLFSAVLTLFISCIGLFGLALLSSEKRTKEVGIRKVMGASTKHVVALLSLDFIKLVLLALLLSIPVTWIVAGKWLQNYPYRIQLGWQVFAWAALLVVLIALSTICFQAVRAALANPVKSLRTE